MGSEAAPLIIVVDDDAAVLNSLSFMLEAEGFKVRAFGDIGELIMAAPMPDAACLILDYAMPAMNGFGVLQWMRERQIKAPAILITARHDRHLRSRALAAGFSRVVEKPLLDHALIDDVRHAIDAGGSCKPPDRRAT